MSRTVVFHVGPWAYRVVILPDLADEDGRLLMGRSDPDSQTIYVSADVAPHARLHVVLHELKHAWDYHCPGTRDAEQEADLSATVTAAAIRDLKSQGGVSALMALLPAGEFENTSAALPATMPGELRYVSVDCIDPAVATAPARGGRAQCGRCELIVADGSVVTSKPRWDPEAQGMIVTRTLFCSHCGHLQTWDEGAGKSGAPNGAVVRGPLVRADPELVEAFLRDHPNAAGMLVE